MIHDNKCTIFNSNAYNPGKNHFQRDGSSCTLCLFPFFLSQFLGLSLSLYLLISSLPVRRLPVQKSASMAMNEAADPIIRALLPSGKNGMISIMANANPELNISTIPRISHLFLPFPFFFRIISFFVCNFAGVNVKHQTGQFVYPPMNKKSV